MSVIIPTYNRPDSLKRAITSVFKQEYRNFEILVIDDTPGNESEKIVNAFPQHRIRYCKGQGEGISSARNLGIRLSTGEYVAFLDDDDEWLPNKLNRQMGMLAVGDKSVGVIHSNCYVDNGSTVRLAHKESMSDRSHQDLLGDNFVKNSTGIVKRDCFNTVGYFDEELPYAEDWDLYIRISKRFRFVYLFEPTAILHWMTNSAAANASSDLRRVTRSYQLLIKKHWKEFEKYRAALSKHLFWIGTHLRVLGLNSVEKKKSAQWYLLKAYLVYPPNFRAIILSCFYAFEDSAVNKRLDFVNAFRSFVKRERFLLNWWNTRTMQ